MVCRSEVATTGLGTLCEALRAPSSCVKANSKAANVSLKWFDWPEAA